MHHCGECKWFVDISSLFITHTPCWSPQLRCCCWYHASCCCCYRWRCDASLSLLLGAYYSPARTLQQLLIKFCTMSCTFYDTCSLFLPFLFSIIYFYSLAVAYQALLHTQFIILATLQLHFVKNIMQNIDKRKACRVYIGGNSAWRCATAHIHTHTVGPACNHRIARSSPWVRTLHNLNLWLPTKLQHTHIQIYTCVLLNTRLVVFAFLSAILEHHLFITIIAGLTLCLSPEICCCMHPLLSSHSLDMCVCGYECGKRV